MADKNHFRLQDVFIDEDPRRRIDKYRENAVSATSVHPATIADAGGVVSAIAKVTFTKNPNVRDALKRTGNINRLLHDSPYVTKVYGIHEADDRVVLLMEEAIASLRDINRDTTEMKALKKELLETRTPKEMAREILQVLDIQLNPALTDPALMEFCL